jgi:hypothetical protein
VTDTAVWEAYVCDNMGFVVDPGVLALIEDPDAIWREYGDCVPDRIVVARGEGKPQPNYGDEDSLRLPASHMVNDRITFDVSEEYADRAAILWRAAQGMAAHLTATEGAA